MKCGWSDVLGHASLLADSIHPNAQGYDQFARGLADSVRKLGLLR